MFEKVNRNLTKTIFLDIILIKVHFLLLKLKKVCYTPPVSKQKKRRERNVKRLHI